MTYLTCRLCGAPIRESVRFLPDGPYHDHSRTCADNLKRERDEARSIARVLADAWDEDGRDPTEDEMRTVATYEPKPNERT